MPHPISRHFMHIPDKKTLLIPQIRMYSWNTHTLSLWNSGMRMFR
jgi:hypothetical protein